MSIDIDSIKKREEEDHIFKLHVGLKKDFKTICISVLMMQSLPLFNSVCTIVQREETRRKVMHEEQDEKGNLQNGWHSWQIKAMKNQ